MKMWKYQLPTDGAPFKLTIPIESDFKAVELQRGVPCLWVEVDPESPQVHWNFEWVGTGHETPDIGVWLGMVQLAGGDLVLHLYDLGHDDDPSPAN